MLWTAFGAVTGRNRDALRRRLVELGTRYSALRIEVHRGLLWVMERTVLQAFRNTEGPQL